MDIRNQIFQLFSQMAPVWDALIEISVKCFLFNVDWLLISANENWASLDKRHLKAIAQIILFQIPLLSVNDSVLKSEHYDSGLFYICKAVNPLGESNAISSANNFKYLPIIGTTLALCFMLMG